MSFLRRIFGRDVKTDTAVQNGYTLVADDTKTSGLDWSDILIRGGLGRDLSTGLNNINVSGYDIDEVGTPGEYYFGTNTAGNKPSTCGLLKVWRESSGILYQIVQSADKTPNRMFSRYYDGTWGPWTEYANTSSIPSASEYVLVKLTGSGNFTVPAGVTSIKVTVVSGGVAALSWVQGSHGSLNTHIHTVGEKGRAVVDVVSVTPGQVIPYVCGDGQTYTKIDSDIDGGVPDFKELVSDGGDPSQFGSIISNPPICRFSLQHPSWTDSGGFVRGSPVEVVDYKSSTRYLGRIPSGVTHNADLPPPPASTSVSNMLWNGYLTYYEPDSTTTYSPGESGYIIIEYSQ